MKKILLFLIVSLFLTIFANSQERISAQPQTAVMGNPVANIPPCFCCDPIAYNLPSPPQITIVGATPPLCACDPIKFTTPPCPGATFAWTVVADNGTVVTFAGGNTNLITLNYSLAQQMGTPPANPATYLTVTLKVCCGNRCVTNTIVVKLKPIPKTNISFSLTDNGSGSYTATATALCGSSFGNGWTLKEVNCPGPIPCNWVSGPIKWQTTGVTINVPNGILLQGKCYVLTHYVNVCSPIWIAGPCTVYGATCFKLDTKSLQIPGNANDRNDAKVCTPEMSQEIQQIK